MLAIIHAVILGIIEGLTEFLPISSTGHLLVAEKVLKFQDTARVFTVVIQLGAIIAVVWHFRTDIWSKVTGFVKGDEYDRHFGLALVIATIPAALAGLALNKFLNTYETLLVVSIALFVGGLVLLWVDAHVKTFKHNTEYELDDIRYRQALMIGLIQAVSLVPGVSRSGATITGGLLSGLDRRTATVFSFYMSIPIMILASGYKIIKDGSQIKNVDGGWLAVGVGLVVCTIVASAVVRWLLIYVSRNSFRIFAYYRIFAGVILFSLVVNHAL